MNLNTTQSLPIPPEVGLSVQLYTIRDHLGDDLRPSLQRLRDIGYAHVEPFDFVGLPDLYLSALLDTGLTAPTAHVDLVQAEAVEVDLEQVIAAANRVGISTLIQPYILPDNWLTRDQIQRNAAQLNSVAQQLREGGLNVAYHNHWWEFDRLDDDTTKFELFVAELDDTVGLQIDTYWVEVGNTSAAEILTQYAPRVIAVHLKDGPINQDESQHVAVGSGRMPIADVLSGTGQALLVVELDGYLGQDIFDPLADSVRYLRGTSGQA